MRASLFFLLFACNTATLTRPDAAPEEDAYVAEEVDAGLPFASTSKLRVIVQPSDGGGALLSAIQRAKSSIHMTMYLLSSKEAVSALIERKNAGVDVKVVLNKDFPNMSASNQAEYDALVKAGVPVKWAPPNFVYTHSKSIVIDNAEVWIMTMNLTFTSPDNREYMVLDTDPRDIEEAEGIFQADFAGTQAPITGRLVVAPINARQKLTGLMKHAQKTLEVEAETLSDNGVVAELIGAKNRGVAVRVVFSDQPGTPAMAGAVSNLRKAGVPMVQLLDPYNHAKAVVVDDIAAYVGSVNFTQNSMDSNRELGVIVVGREVLTVKTTIDADFKRGKPL